MAPKPGKSKVQEIFFVNSDAAHFIQQLLKEPNSQQAHFLPLKHYPGMETSFHYGIDDKHIGFKLREKITTPLGFEVKGKGLFDTVTGSVEYKASLLKNISIGANIKDAGTTPLTLGTYGGHPCKQAPVLCLIGCL